MFFPVSVNHKEQPFSTFKMEDIADVVMGFSKLEVYIIYSILVIICSYFFELYIIETSMVISGWVRFVTVCVMGGSCRFNATGCRFAAMVAPLASSGLERCEAVLHGYETSLLGGRGGVVVLVLTCDRAHS